MEKKTRELSKNVVIFGIGAFGTKIMQVLLIPLYTVYMSTDGYGTSDLVSSSVNLISKVIS